MYRLFGSCTAIAAVDSTDNLLEIYEFLNLYMTTLHKYFPNFSVHSITQNPYKLHSILQEMVVGGIIVETSPVHALSYIRLIDDTAKIS